MKKLFCLFATILILFGCGTIDRKAAFENKYNAMIGKNISELIFELGLPDGVITLQDGHKIYEFSRGREVKTPTYSTPSHTTYNAVGNSVYATTTPGITTGGGFRKYWCVGRVETDEKEIILRWNYEGNSCY